MSNTRDISDQITDMPQEIFDQAMPDAGIAYPDVNLVMGRLSKTCKNLNSFFKEPLAVRALCQAVVDDNGELVKKILDAQPELLLIDPPAGLVIESQLTWQKISAKSALAMACHRRQIKMIELLLPYYDKLEQTDDVIKKKADALSCWSFYETQTNADGENEIVIPPEYASYAQSLINVFARETFPNGVGVDKQFNEDTESALSFLFNIMLLPKSAVTLDNYLDPELFLLALYKAYADSFNANTFQNWDQRDAFCVRVIGLVQGVLSPETAKIFCEGLYYVVEQNQTIGPRAELLKLAGGESFYRASRDSFSGLGFNYLVLGPWVVGGYGAYGMFGKTMSSKNNRFLEYYASTATTPRPICRS